MPSLINALLLRYRRIVRWAPALIILALLSSARAGLGARVRVSGSSRIANPQVTESSGWLMLQGTLEDDAHLPVAAAAIDTTIVGLKADIALSRCDAMPPSELAEALTLETDPLGRFCVMASPEAAGSSLRLRYSGSDTLGPTETKIALAIRPTEVRLSFSVPRLELSLDQGSIAIRVDTRSTANAPLRTVPLKLFIADEQQRQLGETVWVALGQPAFFSVATQQLGAPGPSELIARFDGDASSGPSEAVATLMKIGTVRLAQRGAPSPLDSELGWQITVLGTAHPSSSPNGVVEARNGKLPVAVAQMTDGEATLRLDPGAAEAGRELLISFSATDPWWRMAAPLHVTLPRLSRSQSSATPFWIGALLVAAFFVLQTWRSPRLHMMPRPATGSVGESNSPQIVVISDADRARGFRGHVVDAHDGHVLSGALVELRVSSFTGSQVLATAITDAAGWFVLPEPAGAGDRLLRVTAATHRPIEMTIRRPVEVAVRLTQRRRALISELVNWAKVQRLGLTRSGADPTPGQIARSAEHQGRSGASSWAAAVEDAVFSPAPLDEPRDVELSLGKPGPASDD